tara:strand:- start:4894 stop:6138 length:1245 start_codon:yes stop_codon:yes gene_type:complete
MPTPPIEIRNVDIFDGLSPDLKKNHHLLLEDGKIRAISRHEINAPGATVMSGAGQTLMPGLIDAHFHACLVQVDGYRLDNLPPSLMFVAAGRLLENTLRRGFTTVRDAGGADFGLAEAVRQGLINGPRLFIAGRPLTQTGGHGDGRARHLVEPCLCGTPHHTLIRVVDGVDDIRKAAREEFRRGADQLKLMLNGGVSSSGDPVWLCQFSDDEIRAAVEEARRRRSYVMAHLYQDAQIHKAVSLGIRSVEHGNFLRPDTARYMAAQDAFLVPTLVTYQALREHGASFGFTEDNFAKLDEVRAAGLHSLEHAMAAGVKIGFGTDLLGQMHRYQCDEFRIRAQVQSPFDILKSATSVNAELLGRAGELGVVAEGACADLILIQGNPLKDLSLFDETGSQISAVVKAGRVVCQTGLGS